MTDHHLWSTYIAKTTSPDMRTWLEIKALELGSDNQRERWVSELLPEDEICQLARDEMFKAFEGAPRWKEIKKSEVRHTKLHVTDHLVCADGRHVTFETAEVAELTHDEWSQLKAIDAMVAATRGHEWLVHSGGKVTAQRQTHWATCSTCQSEVCRSSVKVSIEWAGRILTREYAL